MDDSGELGQFVLTGSHQLELREAVSQSLAGRTGILHLLPLSIGELAEAGISFDSFPEYLFNGFLPHVYDKNQRPSRAYSSYYQSYVERDPLVGSLFENLVVLEALKSRYNKGLVSNLYFFRYARRNEIDLLFNSGSEMTGIEIKSASTYPSVFMMMRD